VARGALITPRATFFVEEWSGDFPAPIFSRSLVGPLFIKVAREDSAKGKSDQKIGLKSHIKFDLRFIFADSDRSHT
jgi:hypothetical protein